MRLSQRQQQQRNDRDNTASIPLNRQKQQTTDCEFRAKGEHNGYNDDAQAAENDDETQKEESSFIDEEEEDNDSENTQMARRLLVFEEENVHREDLPGIELEKILVPGKECRLFFAEVHSPFKFWFQLKDNSERIDSLMDRLE